MGVNYNSCQVVFKLISPLKDFRQSYEDLRSECFPISRKLFERLLVYYYLPSKGVSRV